MLRIFLVLSRYILVQNIIQDFCVFYLSIYYLLRLDYYHYGRQ